METTRFSRFELAFMLAVPLGWAVLLLFHPNPTEDIYAGLQGEATTWLIVHLGSLVFIGLLGAVFRLLTRGMPGRAAQVSRLAVTPFVLFYGAGEAILGVATGTLVQHADKVPAAEQPAAAAAVQALWSNVIAADVIIGLGSIAWAVAVIAAGVAHRVAGAPLGVAILLGASAMAVVHTPPFGRSGQSHRRDRLARLAAARQRGPGRHPIPRQDRSATVTASTRRTSKTGWRGGAHPIFHKQRTVPQSCGEFPAARTSAAWTPSLRSERRVTDFSDRTLLSAP
jgi:hypothetical protein